MNEHDVRALVREAIERHLGRPERSAKAEHYDRPAGQHSARAEHHDRPAVQHDRPADHDQRRAIDRGPLVCSAGLQAGPHASHVLLKVLPGSEVDDGMCVIEPRVRCNHCGFCQSFGH
jgi:hypothetical protein